MKKIILMSIMLICITASSFARIRIYQKCCNEACTDKCWVIETCNKQNPCGDLKQVKELNILSASVIGGNLVLILDASSCTKEDILRLKKEGISLGKQTMISKEEIIENRITGAKKSFSLAGTKGSVITTPKNARKRDWPPITITITIKIGK